MAGCDDRAHRATVAARRYLAAVPRPSDDLLEERARPGDRDWGLRRLGEQHEVEGFTVPSDVLPGQPVDLYLSAQRGPVRVEAFRIGWYGGTGARRVLAVARVAVPDQSRMTQFEPATRTVRALWQPTVRVATDGWPPGAYLFRLTASSGAQRYMPFVVRSPDTTAAALMVHATTTWQAYNTWGGYSLYYGPGGPIDYAGRSYVVSFDRPYDLNGAAHFVADELPAVHLVERLNLPVAWTTSTQLDADPRAVMAARAVVTLGHDEYWSPAMREHVTRARDTGVNVVFLGANACFRRIRLQPSVLGPARDVVCYKTDYTLDPMYGVDDAVVTSDWRDLPDPRPESSLTGTMYEGNPTSAAYVVAAPHAWPFAGTGVRAGDAFPDLVGLEYDRVDPEYRVQRPMTVLSHSPLTCQGVHSFSDSAYYSHRGGAGVINTGTMRWVSALDGRFGRRTRRFVTRVTTNVLTEFLAGPAGRSRPAVDNLGAFDEWPGDPLYSRHDLW